MSRLLFSLAAAASVLGGAAVADAPRVVVDIAPIHGLVSRVMDGVGTPNLIVKPGASPHEYSLRPSEAAALQEADVVFWIGPDLTPWLDASMDVLADTASVTGLMDSPGTLRMELRQSALFEAHDHDHAKEDHDSDVHEGHDHDAHDHDEHSDKETADAHGHGHYDSHVWLSPENAALWLGIIADQLSAVDPENAETYKSNASAGRAELDTVVSEVRTVLEPLKDRRFIVFHDAYQYFESSFGLQASGAISLSDASDPSAARIAEIQARIAQEGIDCVLAEPQFNPGLVETVLNGTNAKTGILDPLGSALEPGPDFYPNLIRTLAASLAECL